eukprot:Nk52_evm2s830 gene=Nk52_evmTU2s830
MSSVDKICIPAVEDYHIHLRDGDLMEMVTPYVGQGGACRVYVMPNLIPPITKADDAVAYQHKLQKLSPDTEFLMTLYLHPDITPEEIHKAHSLGVKGVKSYPRGVTTNSDSGIEDYCVYYDVFRAMQECDMVLNLHGEVPSDNDSNICVMNAERHFLNHLQKLHRDFPKLRIVLEHATTREAVEMVKSLGETVACTITAHHLELIVDDWAGKNHHFCKPVAKYPADREALRNVVKEGHHRFFLGSDSAPHARQNKETACGSAGVFTTPSLIQYVATTFEKLGCLDNLVNFTSGYGRKFYKMSDPKKTITLVKKPCKIQKSFPYGNADLEVVPFLAGEVVAWSIEQ